MITDKEIRAFCEGNIADYKIPRYIKLVDSFPLSTNHKVLKNKMREVSIKEFNL